jgi:hypothetical protein
LSASHRFIALGHNMIALAAKGRAQYTRIG